jgi:hypothetical protein
LLAPPNNVKIYRATQAAASGSGFGAGGQNLQVVGPNGMAVGTQVPSAPLNVKTVIIRNLSASTTLLYWFGPAGQVSPPADAYAVLAANGVIAVDMRSDAAPYLIVMPDPTASDAGVEVGWYFYDPTRAPGTISPTFGSP